MKSICPDCGKYTELYSGGEIVEPTLCYICFGAMIGFIYDENTKSFQDEDDIGVIIYERH